MIGRQGAHGSRRGGITVITLSVVLAALGGSTAYATTVPPGAHAVSSIAATTLRDQLNVFSGDRHDLVYVSYRLDAAGRKNTGSERAYVLNDSGNRVSLGRVGRFEEGYAIVDGIVTAENLAPPNFTTEDVYWWNVAAHSHGMTVLPAGESYLSTAPDGLFYRKGHIVYDESTAGVATMIGAPFAVEAPTDIASSTKGFVASGAKGQAAYYDYATKQFTQLKTGTTDYHLGCGAPVSGLIACAAGRILPSGDIVNANDLLSLAGKPAVFVKGPRAIPVTSGAGMSWATHHRLYSVSASGTKTVGAARVDDEGGIVQSGVGGGSIVLTRGGQIQLVSSTGAGGPIKRVRTAPLSPVAVSVFAIGGGRVAWRSDAGPKTSTMVNVGHIDHGVVTGVSVAHLTVSSQALAVSASTLAYGATDAGVAGLEIKSSAGHSEFVRGITYTHVQVLGHLVLYVKNRAAHPGDPLGQAYVYNAATGATKKVGPLVYERAAHDTSLYFQPVAIGGGRVAYQERNGTVMDEDLATGVTEQLRGKGDLDVDSEITAPRVFAFGDYAGWNQGGDGTYRNVVTLTPAVNLTAAVGEFDAIKAFTDAGIVYFNHVRGAGEASQFLLAPYGSITGPVLLGGFFITVPKVAQGSVIWLDRDDVLEAAPLP